jgi:hypothetical protein
MLFLKLQKNLYTFVLLHMAATTRGMKFTASVGPITEYNSIVRKPNTAYHIRLRTVFQAILHADTTDIQAGIHWMICKHLRCSVIQYFMSWNLSISHLLFSISSSQSTLVHLIVSVYTRTSHRLSLHSYISSSQSTLVHLIVSVYTCTSHRLSLHSYICQSLATYRCF